MIPSNHKMTIWSLGLGNEENAKDDLKHIQIPCNLKQIIVWTGLFAFKKKKKLSTELQYI